MEEANGVKKNTCGDFLIAGEIIIIGLAETAHLAAAFLGRSFSWCVILFWGLAGASILAAVIAFLIRKRHIPKMHVFTGLKSMDAAEVVLSVVFAALLVSQLLFISKAGNDYRQGDMTVETVESFLTSDSIYQVNPMTGQPYTEGLPSRLKILCLPALYGSLCRVTSLNPGTVVWGVMPIVTLFSCYMAFASLGNCLFAESRKKRLCFLIAVSLLLWAGTYRYGMDGFGVLYCGWRGTTIRNGVLVPWMLSLCLRKKWLLAVLCVLAEACLVWTLYGMGVCLLVLAGMYAASKIKTISAL